MNEVEKMYENAEPNRNCNLYKHFTECPMKHTQCEDCENFVYPPFTPKKQLSLIIFLSYKYGKGLLINLRTMDKDIDIYDFELFGECLAKLVNELWQDLTEEECKQIRGILE